MSKICVSIGKADMDSALTSARRAAGLADVMEIRLDPINRPQIEPFLAETTTPLLFTNRPEWEGGFFKGPESQRLKLLEQAAEAGSSYIDIELRTDDKQRQHLIDQARNNKCLSLVSWHNFTRTPPERELAEILTRQYESGAHIGKIVTMAHDFTDVLRVLQLQLNAREKNFPLCAFCMGKAGKISRLATLSLGGYMTYAAPDAAANTAPGQFDINTMRHVLEIINGN